MGDRPEGNPRLTNAMSGTDGIAARNRVDRRRALAEPVAEDGEVVRREVLGDADVGLMETRFTRLVEMKKISPSSPEAMYSRTRSTGGL